MKLVVCFFNWYKTNRAFGEKKNFFFFFFLMCPSLSFAKRVSRKLATFRTGQKITRCPLVVWSYLPSCQSCVSFSLYVNVIIMWLANKVLIQKELSDWRKIKTLHRTEIEKIAMWRELFSWLVKLISRRVVSEEVLARTEIPGGGGRGRLRPNSILSPPEWLPH